VLNPNWGLCRDPEGFVEASEDMFTNRWIIVLRDMMLTLVVPNRPRKMDDPAAKNCILMMTMIKIDVAELKRAWDGL